MSSNVLTSPVRRVSHERPLRFPAAALLVATGAIHIPLVAQHLREAPYVGWLFIGLAATCAALAALLLAHGSRPVWLLAAGVSASAVLAYLLSRSVGLPQIGDDIGNWFDPLGVAAVSVETCTVLLAGWVLRRPVRPATNPRPEALRIPY